MIELILEGIKLITSKTKGVVSFENYSRIEKKHFSKTATKITVVHIEIREIV